MNDPIDKDPKPAKAAKSAAPAADAAHAPADAAAVALPAQAPQAPDRHHGMGGLYTVGATGQRELTHRTTPQFAQETRS